MMKPFSQGVFRGLQTLLADSFVPAYSLESGGFTVAEPRAPGMMGVGYPCGMIQQIIVSLYLVVMNKYLRDFFFNWVNFSGIPVGKHFLIRLKI